MWFIINLYSINPEKSDHKHSIFPKNQESVETQLVEFDWDDTRTY